MNYKARIEQFEKRVIAEALAQTRSVAGAARQLKIKRTTLVMKMTRFKLRVPEPVTTRRNPTVPDRSGKGKGYSWHQARRKWQAIACKQGRRTHLGYFDTPLEAAKAYAAFWKS